MASSSETPQEPRFELDLGSDEHLVPPAAAVPPGLPLLDDWLEPARPPAPAGGAAPAVPWIDLAELDLPDLELGAPPPGPAPAPEAPAMAWVPGMLPGALPASARHDGPSWAPPAASPGPAPPAEHPPLAPAEPAPETRVRVGPLELPAEPFNRFLAEAEDALAQFDRLALGRVAHPVAEAAQAAGRLAEDAARLGLDDTARLAAALGAAWQRLEPAPPPADTQAWVDEALRLLRQRLHQHAAGVLRPLPAGFLERGDGLALPAAPAAAPLPPVPPAALWGVLDAAALVEPPTQALRAGLDRLAAALVGLRLEAPPEVEPAAWAAVREAQQALRAQVLRCEEAWAESAARAARLDQALPHTLDGLARRLAESPAATAFLPPSAAVGQLRLPAARLDALARALAGWGEAQQAAGRLTQPVALEAEPEGPLRLVLPAGLDLAGDPALGELADRLEGLGLALDEALGPPCLRVWGWDAPALLPMRAGRREGRLGWVPQAWLQATGLPALGRPAPAAGFEPDWSPAQPMRWTPPPAVLAAWPGLRGVAHDTQGRAWPVSRPR